MEETRRQVGELAKRLRESSNEVKT
jgi:hypothetical protein